MLSFSFKFEGHYFELNLKRSTSGEPIGFTFFFTNHVELALVHSRAHASRLYQVLKRSLAHWIKVWTKSRRIRRPSREDFQEDLCHICKCRDFVFKKI